MQFSGGPIHILVVEDTEVDFELLVLQLIEGGVHAECTRVETAAQVREALASQEWDAIISDYSLPGFSGLEALQIHREVGGLIPFLFTSGTVGEQAAVECMRRGAQDFVLKGHKRLVPALLRELEESKKRKEAQATQDRHRQIVESSVSGIFCADCDGHVTFLNARGEEILARTLSGGSVVELFSQARGAEVDSALSPPYLEMATFAFELDGKDLHMALRPLQDGGVLGQFTDVTRERSLEQRLVLSQKMEALGRLASGVAHDFNNTLTVILGFTGLLREELPKGNAQELLSLVEDAAERGSALSRQILAVARQQELNLETIELRHHVDSIQPLLRQAAGPHVELEIRCEAENDRVRFDPNLLLQVLINLIVNARDAMTKGERPARGSRIVISCSDAMLDENQASVIDSRLGPGHYVTLAVSDNGCGMDEETRQRISSRFTPPSPTAPAWGWPASTARWLRVAAESGCIANWSAAPPLRFTCPAWCRPSRFRMRCPSPRASICCWWWTIARPRAAWCARCFSGTVIRCWKRLPVKRRCVGSTTTLSGWICWSATWCCPT
jgi:signal transduction histidine kinase